GSGDVGNCPATRLGVEARLTPDALLSLRCIHETFTTITDIGGVRADAIPDHPSGRALDLMVPDYQTAAGKAFGWKVARWLRAHQKQLGIEYVIWDNRIWNIKRDDEGWRVFRASGQGSPSELHTNHVHVTVFGKAAKPDGPATDQVAADGAWHTPVGQPSSVGCGMGCYGGHTGQDYPSPPGTPVYAVNAGTVTRSESITSSGSCTTLPICGGTRVSYGNLIVLKLAGGGETTAWYAHLTARRVRVGDVVQSGQVIGTVGFQGNVRPAGPGGSHLHFEIRQKGTPVNPLPYLRQKGTQS
ncbi:MAG: M23 family metallopeptidase, partial [Microlunatus sp.]|nr:M23 family metallopeptidase [Microlunatus sp.]